MGRFLGKRVVIIGDSLSDGAGSPGDLLALELRGRSAASVQVNARCGRSAVSLFANATARCAHAPESLRKVQELIATRPDIVLIFLGTNDLMRDPVATRDAFLALIAMAHAIGAQVIHIGPPTYRSDVRPEEGPTLNERADELVQRLFTQLPVDLFLDARPLTSDLTTTAAGRAGDGIHFGRRAAELFASRLAAALDGQALRRFGGRAAAVVAAVGAAALTSAIAAWVLTRR